MYASVSDERPEMPATTVLRWNGNAPYRLQVAPRSEELTLRALGDNLTFTRWQWHELLDSLNPDSELAERVRQLMAPSDVGG